MTTSSDTKIYCSYYIKNPCRKKQYDTIIVRSPTTFTKDLPKIVTSEINAAHTWNTEHFKSIAVVKLVNTEEIYPLCLFLDAPFTEKPKNPAQWKKSQVVQWFKSMCDKYEIDEEDISGLMMLNGEGLNELKDKDDWIRRSPKQGDLMYNLWRKLNAEFLKQETLSPLTDEKVDSHEDVNIAASMQQVEVNITDFQKEDAGAGKSWFPCQIKVSETNI